MNVPNLYRKIKQILNDSNIALVNRGLNESTSLNGVCSEINELEINRLPYLLRNELIELNESDFNGCSAIGGYMFYDCDRLTSITIPDSVTSIGASAFERTGYYDDPNNWSNDILYIGRHLVNAKTSILGECKVKDGTLTISDSAFYNCTSLTSITIPDSIKTIANGVFSYCTSLTSVTLPDGVTSIDEQAFNQCTSLTSITIPDSVTSIRQGAFRNCTSLTSVTIPDGVEFGLNVFSGCKGLTSVTICGSATRIGSGCFNGCTNLTDIYLYPITPPSIQRSTFPTTITTIHVPIGSGDTYRSATNWSLFANKIVEDMVV